MNPPPIRFIPWIWLATLTALYLWGSPYGTPSWERTRLIFPTLQELERHVPAMLELRQQYHEKQLRTFQGKNKERDFFYHHRTQPFMQLPVEVVLDAARGYLIGLPNSDEQKTLSVLSRLRPKQLELNPHDPLYGGLYYYLSGGLLGLGGLLRFFSLKPDAGFYLSHPGQTRRMYWMLRVFSAASAIASFAFLCGFLRRRFPLWVSLSSVSWLALNPWMAAIGHMINPHSLSLALLSIALYQMGRDLSPEKAKRQAVSLGLLLGAMASCLLTNGFFFPLGIAYFWIWTKENKLDQSIFLKLVRLYALIYGTCVLSTNFYLLFSWQELIERARINRILFAYGEWSFSRSLPFLKSYFAKAHLWLSLPIVLVGITNCLQHSRGLKRLICGYALFYFILMVLYLRHENAFTIGLPLGVILFAQGLHCLSQSP